ncbi:bcl-2-binding component 3 [Emydura macquarii macquarii]|uniref:bcl-2-binding component 3 n=1 Tax=Emydura macquarii macquarii TaxID=1129001 RepID=UPI00352AAA34
MARPLQEGSCAEPTAAVPGDPAFLLGGAVAVPPSICQGSLALPPRLNCGLCPDGPAPCSLYRCIRGPEPPRSRGGSSSSSIRRWDAPETGGTRGDVVHGRLPHTQDQGPDGEQPPTEPTPEDAVPNGYLPREPLDPERELGARLRRMGDAFHQAHERQLRERQRQGALWARFYHFISQLLGAFYNMPVDVLPEPQPN